MVGEVVEHLLDADGVLGREDVLIEEAPDVGIAGRIDVDREGRLGVLADVLKWVVDDRGEGFGRELRLSSSARLACLELKPAAPARQLAAGCWLAAGSSAEAAPDSSCLDRSGGDDRRRLRQPGLAAEPGLSALLSSACGMPGVAEAR